MDKVRIGFVGVGRMGQAAHLRNYVTRDDCRVVALAETRPKTARLVADRYGVGKVYPDHRELLARERLDGVVACQPFAHHAALLPEIYPHVRHVLTEKPLAVWPAAGEALAAAARKAGCVHMVAYHKRSDPATAHARAVIDDWRRTGRVGRMRYVRILMPPGDWIAGGFEGVLDGGEARPASPAEPAPADVGAADAEAYTAFVNYYIHQVNLMRHLLGEPYRLAWADPTGVLLVVESASGTPGTIEMAPYATTGSWEESALIGFDRGRIRLDLPAPLARNRPGAVEVLADPGEGPARHERPVLPAIDAMRRQAANFVAVCRDEVPPPCDADEAVADLHAARHYVRLLEKARKQRQNKE